MLSYGSGFENSHNHDIVITCLVLFSFLLLLLGLPSCGRPESKNADRRRRRRRRRRCKNTSHRQKATEVKLEPVELFSVVYCFKLNKQIS